MNCFGGEPDLTPLDDYVAKPDPTYSWKLVKTIPGDGCTSFVVDMKSQTWRSSPEVDRPVWQHWVTIVKPEVVKHDTAFLLIGGGSNDRPAPSKPDSIVLAFAKATSYFDDLKGVKYIRYVPNAEHSLNGDAVQSILAFYQGVLKGSPLPKFSWKLETDGSIQVRAEDKPKQVNLWQATNPKARDFRLERSAVPTRSRRCTPRATGCTSPK